ncbi:MAG: DUF58 domain-containing protein [Polyangiaceae bacterium]|nr:DUF58 domain-containing protein [Polyangiaceae bacterium]MCL4228451.1 DUF58 domain-containing protein [Myxococcales bacterium]
MLPAELAREVKRIQFVTGRQVASVMAGAYLSVFKGRGMEFDEVRPYVPGDDVRSIDWNVTARTGEPHVKRYVEERELTVMLLCDISQSQDFGSGRRSKLEAAVELCALLALSAVGNGDKVGLLLFHGGADTFIPPRKGDKHALRIIREVFARGHEPPRARARWNPAEIPRRLWAWFRRLDETSRREARRSTSIAAALEVCRQVLPRRAVVFLISDFLDEGYLDVLRHANRKHDVVAVAVTDPRELELVPAGLVTLEDAETGDTRLVDTRSPDYRERVAADARARLDRLEDELSASGVDLVRLDAQGSVVDPLLRFFRERQRRARR